MGKPPSVTQGLPTSLKIYFSTEAPSPPYLTPGLLSSPVGWVPDKKRKGSKKKKKKKHGPNTVVKSPL